MANPRYFDRKEKNILRKKRRENAGNQKFSGNQYFYLFIFFSLSIFLECFQNIYFFTQFTDSAVQKVESLV